MTIYSQHANRGKVQILATYRGPTGVQSSTVTSVDDTRIAAPIVDSLNRISAFATVPVSEWDERGQRFRRYPTDHLAALTDTAARQNLLEGAYGLWYVQAMLLLHQALNDLDIAVAAVPKPVKTAISAELATEVRALRDELAEYSEAIEPPDYEKRRFWESDAPFTVSGDSVSGLSQEDRRTLDALERGLSQADLERAAADLRLLHDAYQKCSNEEARLLIEGFEISDDPYDEEEELYFLNVQAPMPDGKWDRTNWNIELCRWVSDGPDSNSAKGEPLLDCGRAEPPSLAEIVGLLNASNGQTDVLADWAKTPVGEALAGTAFVVTKRYEV